MKVNAPDTNLNIPNFEEYCKILLLKYTQVG